MSAGAASPPRAVLELPEHAAAALRIVFPTLELAQIRWIEGIPRLFRAGQSAITLGALSSRRTADIFFAPGVFDTRTCTALSILVHEAAHVWQVRTMAGGRGFWIFRVFYLRYVLDWIRRGFSYEKIRYEREAFAIQRRFLDAARAAAVARPDLPCLEDDLPDPAHHEFRAAFAVEWARTLRFGAGIDS